MIKFISLNIKYIDCQLILKLVKILKKIEIKDKLFEIVINNTSNNNIFKNKFDKTLNWQEF